MQAISDLFHIDALSILMVGLISFITLVVVSFSRRYMRGDRKKPAFYLRIAILFISIAVMVSANHLGLFLGAWIVSNLFLTRLMLHKSEWPAAVASANLALKNFAIGTVSLTVGFLIIATNSPSLLISEIDLANFSGLELSVASLLIIIAALSQSAIWPFHRWLISSLNSPTPVSALMHAGLVNGGGFLLARFAPILLQQSMLMNFIFIAGILTAVIGTYWKLIQSDVKRMLACSTMGQMGFMIAECGLGLFAAAVSHLIWHGMFKAYLFLNSGGTAAEDRLAKSATSVQDFVLAALIGVVGLYSFSLVTNSPLVPNDTTVLISLLAWMACCQGALSVLQSQFAWRGLVATIPSVLIGAIYGLNLLMVEAFLQPLDIQQAQPLNALHLIAALVLIGAWLAMLVSQRKKSQATAQTPASWQLKLYVGQLNASQPDPKTVTAHRNHYQY